MKRSFWSSVCAVGFSLALLGTIVDGASAQRGGGRGGGRSSGGGTAPSREGPAATGSMSSGSASGGSGQRAQARGENQAARQDSRGDAQAGRQATASNVQANRIEAYNDNNWDEGKGLAIVATGAVVAGTVSAISSAGAAPPPPPPQGAPAQFATAPATPPPPAPGPPCANAQEVPVGEVTYTKCGSTWYTMAFGANGPVYVQSAPPPGA